MFSRGFTQRKRELILYLESLTWQTATAGKMHLVAKRNYIRPVKHQAGKTFTHLYIRIKMEKLCTVFQDKQYENEEKLPV